MSTWITTTAKQINKKSFFIFTLDCVEVVLLILTLNKLYSLDKGKLDGVCNIFCMRNLGDIRRQSERNAHVYMIDNERNNFDHILGGTLIQTRRKKRTLKTKLYRWYFNVWKIV